MPISRLKRKTPTALGYARRAALRARPTMIAGGNRYTDRVLGTMPIAYWPLDEASGSVARCLVNPAQNGAATGVTWANDSSGPFGTQAPYFDGANDYVDIFSAAFDAAFNGATGTKMVWIRVANAGVWTDGTRREIVHFYDDATNFYRLSKSNLANQLTTLNQIGGGLAFVDRAGSTEVTWSNVAVTWSDANHDDEVRLYFNGAIVGAPHAGGNVWAGGGLSVNNTTIGASSIVPANVFHGWLAHGAVWDRALGAGEILGLANP